MKNIKFGRKPTNFQNELKKDEKIIKSDERAFIKADKSTNYYKMHVMCEGSILYTVQT